MTAKTNTIDQTTTRTWDELATWYAAVSAARREHGRRLREASGEVQAYGLRENRPADAAAALRG